MAMLVYQRVSWGHWDHLGASGTRIMLQRRHEKPRNGREPNLRISKATKFRSWRTTPGPGQQAKLERNSTPCNPTP